jgi:Mn-dependent DtxR family transcriptional regulator
VTHDRRTAARALAHGDPLAALAAIGDATDALGLSLRAVAFGQLEEWPAAVRDLRRVAAVAHRTGDRRLAARVAAAQAELALARRDLPRADRAARRAVEALSRTGDRENLAWARLVLARLELWLGRPDRASAELALAGTGELPVHRAMRRLVQAELALRALRASAAAGALEEALALARAERLASLTAEIERCRAALARPIGTAITAGQARPVNALDLERARVSSGSLVIDGFAGRLGAPITVELQRRPVLLALLLELGLAIGPVAAASLARAAFGAGRMDEVRRARLRVELGRLRRLLDPVASVLPEEGGWRLDSPQPVLVLLPDGPREHAAIRALLAEGRPWGTASVARAVARTPRTVQRALRELAERGEVVAEGRGAARRWRLAGAAPIATPMLLLGAVVPR